MRSWPQVLLVILVVALQAGAESDGRSDDDGAATHLFHLASALAGLKSDKPEDRRLAIGRLLFYRGDPVSDGILVEHWFAEPDSANRAAILRGLLSNGTLSRERVALFRIGAAIHGPRRRRSVEGTR